MKRIYILLCCLPLLAQTRMIPHVTAAGGTFQSTLILTNTTGLEAAYTLGAYAADGTFLVNGQGTLGPGETVYRTVSEVFGREDLSHFTIDAPDTVTVSIAYQAVGDGVGPAHVNETADASQVWRLYAGNGDVTWDGLAMVNVGSNPTTVTARQVDGNGQTVGSTTLATDLAVNGKALAVLSLTFTSTPGTYYEVFAQEPLSIVALRGNQSSDFLWQNEGIAVAEQSPANLSWDFEQAFGRLFFNGLIEMVVPDHDNSRVYAVLRNGVIEFFDNDDDAATKTTFLDISSKIATSGELGLLGMVFHPNYAENGHVFVNYATSVNGLRSVVSRFTANGPDALDPNSEMVLLEIEQPFDNHNGGQLAFGPDGYLYIGFGDGGGGGDPQNNAQNPANALGSMLRIDINQEDGNNNYTIPADNPFVGNSQGWLEETYAYGLRNPWRYGFDVWAGNSTLIAADVGQGDIEEVDVITSGGNYGWRIMEGNLCFNPSTNCNVEGLVMPIHTYNHDADDRSITGGVVYRGSKEPALFGKYVYGDFVSGRVWALDMDNAFENTLLVESGRNPVSFANDGKGGILMCHIGGSVFRLVQTAP